MKGVFLIVALALSVSSVLSQRPFYAGLKPIGYPDLASRFDPEEIPTTQANLVNRFGADGQPITTTTMRLPVDALGDRELVDRISKWPRDKWPFWYANWVAIEEHRRRPVSNTITSNTRSSFARDPNIDRIQSQNQNAQNQNFGGNQNRNQQYPL